MTAVARLLRPGSWTLRSKLVASIVLLFIVVTTAVAGLTVARLQTTLVNQVDDQLRSSAVAVSPPPSDTQGDGEVRAGVRRRVAMGGPAAGAESLRLDVASDGTVISEREFTPGSTEVKFVQSASISSFGQRTQLTTAQVARLRQVPNNGAPHTVDLGGSVGDYRVVAVTHPMEVTSSEGDTSIVATTTIGLPLTPANNTVRNTALTVGLLSGAAILLLGGGTAWVIQRNLRPLRRVAATATRVSHLPLSSGDTGTGERVAERDTDPHTEVGQVGAALNGLLDHVDQSLTARHQSEMQVRQFVADASHELRTPLSSIKGYAELSRRETDPVPPGVTHALGRIESESNRMTTLVEDLLLLARLDAGRPLDREPVDLSRLVVESVSDAHAAGRDHQWALDLPDEPAEVIGDEARLRQVLINLLANARRHTPDGTEVRTAIRPQADHVDVTVTDNGPGIPAEQLPHIFERFARGDSARTRVEGSTGLGLSIVHAVVAAHEGTVHVTSAPGHTEFTLRLPRSLATAAATESGAIAPA